MKFTKLIAVVIGLTISSTSFGIELLGAYACRSEDGTLIKFETEYGELSVLDSDGNLTVDSGDGYNVQVVEIETLPVQYLVKVSHHEEPEISTLQFIFMDEYKRPYSGYFQDINGVRIGVTCL